MAETLPKLAFFGSDAICLPLLDYLAGEAASRCQLAAVISQPDRAKGRGRRLQPNPVAAWARDRGVELLQPERPDATLADWLAERGIAASLVMAYGAFLPSKVRHAARQDMLNFHGSILPRYRGASPVETAVAMGEKETGVSLMRVDAKMDAGGVADVERVRIDESDTGGSLRGKIGQASVPLLRRNLGAVLGGGLDFREQDPALVSYCRKLTKADGAIDFRLDAKTLHARIRAFDPWPGAFFEHAGDRIKVGAAHWEAGEAKAPPGTVLAHAGGMAVATAGGILVFSSLQRPGGRMLPVADFLRGYAIAEGSVLESIATEPLVRD